MNEERNQKLTWTGCHQGNERRKNAAGKTTDENQNVFLVSRFQHEEYSKMLLHLSMTFAGDSLDF